MTMPAAVRAGMFVLAALLVLTAAPPNVVATMGTTHPGDYACISDQYPVGDNDFSTADPYVSVDPGQAAAQSFRPAMNVLCMVGFELWIDWADLGQRIVYDLSIREALDGHAVATLHVDKVFTEGSAQSWSPYVPIVPERDYYIVVDVAAEGRPIRWYRTSVDYTRGSAFVRNGTAWTPESSDLFFGTSGFNDASAYPLPDPAWTPDEWKNNSWKTYPQYASWVDLDLDGTEDVYSYNNSYYDGSPVSVNGTVDIQTVDRSRMSPVNLSMAFEFTSYRNGSDNRSTLKIIVERMADAFSNRSSSWPAWLVITDAGLLPRLFSPPGTNLTNLNLTWESTLEPDAFRVYLKNVTDRPRPEAWIYIGHFSVQTIIIRGPAVTGSPPADGNGTTVTPPIAPGGPLLGPMTWLALGGVLVLLATTTLLRRHRRTRNPP